MTLAEPNYLSLRERVIYKINYHTYMVETGSKGASRGVVPYHKAKVAAYKELLTELDKELVNS